MKRGESSGGGGKRRKLEDDERGEINFKLRLGTQMQKMSVTVTHSEKKVKWWIGRVRRQFGKKVNNLVVGINVHFSSSGELATIELGLEKLLFTTRMPLSMQQPVWADQDTTFREVVADPGIEIPDVSVAKQLMRQHVRNLLRILSRRERQIIRLRFGIEDGKHKSLSEIGNLYGLSKERVRQLEGRALYKLKQCLDSQGLDACTSLLI